MDVSDDHGASYGDTLTWDPRDPAAHGSLAEVQVDLDKAKFYKEFVDLMIGPTPPAPKPR